MKCKFLIEEIIVVDSKCLCVIEFRSGIMIKIPRPSSIFNVLGSKFNTSVHWDRQDKFSTRFKMLRYTSEGLKIKKYA
jgi:hypothetical protein